MSRIHTVLILTLCAVAIGCGKGFERASQSASSTSASASPSPSPTPAPTPAPAAPAPAENIGQPYMLWNLGGGPWFANSGQASSAQYASSAVNVPAGTFVIAMPHALVTTGQSFTSFYDSAGNNYTVVNATLNGGAYTVAYAYAVITNPIPIGTTFTGVVTGGASVGLEGVWAVPGVGGVKDVDVANVSASPGSTTALPSGILVHAQEILFGFIYVGNPVGEQTSYQAEVNGFTSLWHDDYVDITYQIVDSTNSVTWAPSWSATSDTSFSALLMSFY